MFTFASQHLVDDCQSLRCIDLISRSSVSTGSIMRAMSFEDAAWRKCSGSAPGAERVRKHLVGGRRWCAAAPTAVVSEKPKC